MERKRKAIHTIDGSGITDFLERLAENQVGHIEAVTFLKMMSEKQTTTADMVTFIEYLQQNYPLRQIEQGKYAVNIVGTGGGRSTFNISTTASFVAAGAGAVVIKSGSPSYTSRCGSIDVLRALGVNLNITFEKFKQMVDTIGIGFVSTNWYPPILRRLAIAIQPESFKSLGGFVNTIGPLLCPVSVRYHLIGVRSMMLLDQIATAASSLNHMDAIVCRSEIGLDEFCSFGTNAYRQVHMNEVGALTWFDAGDAAPEKIDELSGGDAEFNAEVLLGILSGRIRGVKRDTVLINSAFALMLAGIAENVSHGVRLSAESIDQGRAIRKLNSARKLS